MLVMLNWQILAHGGIVHCVMEWWVTINFEYNAHPIMHDLVGPMEVHYTYMCVWACVLAMLCFCPCHPNDFVFHQRINLFTTRWSRWESSYLELSLGITLFLMCMSMIEDESRKSLGTWAMWILAGNAIYSHAYTKDNAYVRSLLMHLAVRNMPKLHLLTNDHGLCHMVDCLQLAVGSNNKASYIRQRHTTQSMIKTIHNAGLNESPFR